MILLPSTKFLIFIFIGTLAMLAPMLIMSKWYAIPSWKTVLATLFLTICGVLGTYIWFWLETGGRWSGRSFYGAVFLVPMMFLAVAPILRISYSRLMDLCAPAECIMLVLMKVLCILDGCCGGMLLWTTESGTEVFFPSQIVELINAAVLCVALLWISRKEKQQGLIYPWYLLLYGATRFVLNFFREQSNLRLTNGGIWSLIAVVIGGTFILVCHYRRKKKERVDLV